MDRINTERQYDVSSNASEEDTGTSAWQSAKEAHDALVDLWAASDDNTGVISDGEWELRYELVDVRPDPEAPHGHEFAVEAVSRHA